MPSGEHQHVRSTLTDVARVAGVSLATASKAINGRAEVAASTRRRVLDAAEELAFVPNQLARSLVEGQSRTVGILTNDLEGRFVIPILMGAEDALGSGKISVFLCDARGDAIREQHHLQALLNRRIDGLIVVGDTTNPRRPLKVSDPLPIVYAYAPSEDLSDSSVVPDNVAGGRMAVEHLISLGRKRLAHISGDPAYAAAKDRASGVESALAEAHLELVGTTMFSNWSEHWGPTAARALLARFPDIDGIVCGSDQIARGALDTLRDLDRKVPDEVAVIGCDNWEVLATNSRPELTSVDANLKMLGSTAAMRIFEAIESDTAPEAGITKMPVRLVIRDSTIPRW